MKQMGIQSQEIDAVEVIIKTKDKELVSSNPKVSKVKRGGNEVMQITGDFEERSLEKFSDDDVKMIIEQTGCCKHIALRRPARLSRCAGGVQRRAATGGYYAFIYSDR